MKSLIRPLLALSLGALLVSPALAASQATSTRPSTHSSSQREDARRHDEAGGRARRPQHRDRGAARGPARASATPTRRRSSPAGRTSRRTSSCTKKIVPESTYKQVQRATSIAKQSSRSQSRSVASGPGRRRAAPALAARDRSPRSRAMESLLAQVRLRAPLRSASPFEGEAVLLAAALLARRGFFRLPVVIAVAVAANALADQVYFQLARLRGRAWLEQRFGQHPRFQRLIDLVGRRGGLAARRQPLRLRPAHRDPRRVRRPRHGRRGLHAARPPGRPRSGPCPIGGPRLLGRRRARAAARRRAPLRGWRSRSSSSSPSRSSLGLRHARRAVRWRELGRCGPTSTRWCRSSSA